MTSTRKIVVGTEFKETENYWGCAVILIHDTGHWLWWRNRDYYSLLILGGKDRGKVIHEYYSNLDDLIEEEGLGEMEVVSY